MKLDDGNLWVQETYVDETKGYRFGESEVYETWTNDTGVLFREMQREYGRCVSRVYHDTDHGVEAIGWVFEKTMPYEDARDPKRDTYVRSVWVTLHAPVTVVEQRPHEVHPVLAMTEA
jgi:hypothetical protein